MLVGLLKSCRKVITLDMIHCEGKVAKKHRGGYNGLL